MSLDKKVRNVKYNRIIYLVILFLSLVISILYLNHPDEQTDWQVTQSITTESLTIDQLTAEERVVHYLKTYQHLPDYYLTKQQAREQGWNAASGNLCDVLPGKAIGGDHFSNREKLLPEKPNRHWFETDINYRCGRRGGERLLYSSDGLIYVTYDHYRHASLVQG